MTATPEAIAGELPLPNTYWVQQAGLLAGEYPGVAEDAETDARIDRLLRAGVNAFVDLTAPGEVSPYHPRLPLSVEYDRRPIKDHGVPENFQQMNEIVDLINDARRRRRVVYVHCRAGIGRTGTAIACLLADGGMTGEAALEQLNQLWVQSARSYNYSTVPETPEQAAFVLDWAKFRLSSAERAPPSDASADHSPAPIENPIPLATQPRLQQRFTGSMLGLAIGEAVAAATQGLVRGEFAPVTGLTGGGPSKLPRGAWGDDTAMALCLADSLLAKADFDPRDQVARYQRWQTEGYLSATGLCIGIEANTAKALGAARWRRQAYAGSHDPTQLDPEPLARVAPVVLYFQANAAQAVERAAESARTISQAPLVLAATRCAAVILQRMLVGQDRSALLALDRRGVVLPPGPESARLAAIVDGKFRSSRIEALRPDGDIIDVLECALWVLWHARDFRDAVLMAANLGGRSDVIAACVGQIAGARFGLASIPAEWLGVLARREIIAEFADRLYAASQVGTSA
jgi:ADP-ribosyl-[dinitrogen reductase] hydrolase